MGPGAYPTTAIEQGQLREWRPFSIWRLAAGYFSAYLLYAALARLVGHDSPDWRSLFIGLALVCGPALSILLRRAWRIGAGQRRGVNLRGVLSLVTSGVATAIIAVTTLLIVGSPSLGILTALVFMRGGVLLLGPVWDRIVNRAPTRLAFAALALCAAAVALPLISAGGLSALGSTSIPLVLYLAGYCVRIGAMSHHAKRSEPAIRAVWLAGELAVCLIALGSVLWLLPQAGIARQASVALPQVAIGAAYGVVLLFGSLIYLDPSDNSRSIPVNRASSLLAGLFLSVLMFTLGRSGEGPTPAALVAGSLLAGALWLLYREDADRTIRQ